MFKHLIHWRTYRQIYQLEKTHQWKAALDLAKQINDKELAALCALCLCTQLIKELEND